MMKGVLFALAVGASVLLVSPQAATAAPAGLQGAHAAQHSDVEKVHGRRHGHHRHWHRHHHHHHGHHHWRRHHHYGPHASFGFSFGPWYGYSPRYYHHRHHHHYRHWHW